MIQPVRLRLSRRRGFDLEAHSRATNGLPVVNVARPGRWGNPFDFRDPGFSWLAVMTYGCRGDVRGRREASVKAFAEWIDPGRGRRTVALERRVIADAGGEQVEIGKGVKVGTAPSLSDLIAALRGRNLACWCDEGACHADVLLLLANRDNHDAADAQPGDRACEQLAARIA